MTMGRWLRAGVTVLLALAAAPSSGASGCDEGRTGMTWGKLSQGNGVVLVGCSGCNPYQGETQCSRRLPVLCLRKEGSPAPPQGVSPTFYEGWARGRVALTRPVVGAELRSLADANARCVAAFGAGWRMAEFHDGDGGWGWRAFGDLPADMRFWVHINDQRANCWDSEPERPAPEEQKKPCPTKVS
ncbi:flagellar hook-length control protein [Myxococcus sp. K15C18031901]|uniref:flagellar hook-length control protein n=1 Tax=Myxococcus dinghuensis TaxID=2906761 RepID=UPI0020A75230|nr:flagellar hook-length control protein [Myxococcus dinghuensis]MCP3105119.1 flagellar hook-length control protein [Myxococcus dinghuensis]